MEPHNAPAHAVADGLVLLVVLGLAVAAAVAPRAVILVGLPLLAGQQVLTRRHRAS